MKTEGRYVLPKKQMVKRGGGRSTVRGRRPESRCLLFNTTLVNPTHPLYIYIYIDIYVYISLLP